MLVESVACFDIPLLSMKKLGKTRLLLKNRILILKYLKFQSFYKNLKMKIGAIAAPIDEPFLDLSKYRDIIKFFQIKLLKTNKPQL